MGILTGSNDSQKKSSGVLFGSGGVQGFREDFQPTVDRARTQNRQRAGRAQATKRSEDALEFARKFNDITDDLARVKIRRSIQRKAEEGDEESALRIQALDQFEQANAEQGVLAGLGGSQSGKTRGGKILDVVKQIPGQVVDRARGVAEQSLAVLPGNLTQAEKLTELRDKGQISQEAFDQLINESLDLANIDPNASAVETFGRSAAGFGEALLDASAIGSAARGGIKAATAEGAAGGAAGGIAEDFSVDAAAKGALVGGILGGGLAVGGRAVSKGVQKARGVSIKPPTIKTPKLSRARKLQEQFLDKQAPLVRAVRQIEQTTGRKLKGADDPVTLARLAAGAGGRADIVIDQYDKLLRGIGDINLQNDVMRLGQARRLLSEPKLRPQLAKRAQETLDDLTTKYGDDIASLDGAVQQHTQFQNDLLRSLADDGVYSTEFVESLIKNNPDYFSKIDVLEKLEENPGIGSKSLNVTEGKVVKRQKGFEGELELLDPRESTVRQIMLVEQIRSKNRVGNAIGRIADDSDGLFVKGERPRGYDTIDYLDGGVRKQVSVPKDVAEAFKGLNAQQIDAVTGFMGKTSKAFRGAVTKWNPAFAFLRNPQRDFRSFMINSDFIPVHRTLDKWVRGFYESITDGQFRKEFIEAGGDQAGFLDFGRKSTKKVARQLGKNKISPGSVVRSPVKAYEKVAQAFEEAGRLAEFRAAREAGEDVASAAAAGRGVTVDFAQAGSAGQTLNLWVPFLNARLQGSRRTAQAFARNPARVATAYAATSALPIAMLMKHNLTNHKDVWDGITDHEKDKNFIFIYGDDKDEDGRYTQVFKWRKGEIDTLLGNPIQYGIDNIFGSGDKNAAGVILEALDSVAPFSFVNEDGNVSLDRLSSNLPPALKAPIQQAANRNFFFESDIVPENLQDLEPEEQTFGNRTIFAELGAKIFNASPLRVETLLNDLFGSAPRNLDPERLTNPADPFTRDLIGAAGRQLENEFFDNRDTARSQRVRNSKKVTELVKDGKINEARRRAEEHNSQVDEIFQTFDEKFGDIAPESLDSFRQELYINLTERSIQSRKR